MREAWCCSFLPIDQNDLKRPLLRTLMQSSLTLRMRLRPSRKDRAREALGRALNSFDVSATPFLLRINPASTAWHKADIVKHSPAYP